MLVVVTLVGFFAYVGLYFGLAAGVAWLGYQVATAGPELLVISPGASPSPGHLVAWLGVLGVIAIVQLSFVRGAFRRLKTDRSKFVPVTRAEEPQLIEFVDRVCDDVDAPRPRGVCLSTDVTAGVTYDSSLLNLVLPVKKHLVIGAGLVNALTVDELKAVLARELGHFSHRAIRLDSYLRVVAGAVDNMVRGRDGSDRLLMQWRQSDAVTLATFGWLITLLRGLPRVALVVPFAGLAVLHRALRRQMELQADKVAVRVTGSDSLIRALYKLRFAEQCLAFAKHELLHALDHDLRSDNLFVHQTAAGDHLRRRRRDASLGHPPPLPDDPSQVVSIFDSESPDERSTLWSLHPSDQERERRAQRPYVRSVLDDRSAWLLFRDPEATQKLLTAGLYADGAELEPAADVQRHIDNELAATSFDPRWRGAYDVRDLGAAAVHEALAEESVALARDPAQELATLLSDDLEARVDAYRRCLDDRDALQSLQTNGPPRRFHFRGAKRRGAEVPALVDEVEEEAAEHRRALAASDSALLRLHRALARDLGDGSEHDLLGRLRFHVEVVRLYDRFGAARDRVAQAARQLNETPVEPTAEQVASCVERISDGYHGVREALEAAGELRFPALTLHAPGESVGEFLLEEDLVPHDFISARAVDREHLEAFFEQVAEVRDKLLRIRRKSLAAIIGRLERIADTWHLARSAANLGVLRSASGAGRWARPDASASPGG